MYNRLLLRTAVQSSKNRLVFARNSRLPILASRFASTTTATTASTSTSAPIDPKIQSIVDQISSLTLLETATLVSELKTKLNIPDYALAGGVASIGGNNNNSASANADEVEDTGAKASSKEKTVFNIKLDSFDTKSKAKVIKEVKGLLGLSLVEAKKFVESAPKLLRENVAKDDAEKIKKTLEDLGARVVLE